MTNFNSKKLDRECVHTQLFKAQEVKINLGEEVEFEQQSKLIEQWVEEEEKRLPPSPPMSPFTY